MVDESPPSWVPVDQHVGQVPVRITQDVDSASIVPRPEQDVNALAKQIIRDNQPVINRFVAVQRQQVELGDKDVHNNVLPLKELTVYYQNVQGLERMHYHISPKVEEPAEVKVPEVEEIKPPTPPTPEEPEETPAPRVPETKVPELAEPPKVEEPKPPEEEELPGFEEPKLPEEEKPPEEEAKVPEEEKPPEEEPLPEEEELKAAPEFIEVDVACFLPVTFGNEAGDAPRGPKE